MLGHHSGGGCCKAKDLQKRDEMSEARTKRRASNEPRGLAALRKRAPVDHIRRPEKKR
jgi:hypothetical protein